MDYIRNLAKRVLRSWNAVDRDELAFSEIAARALEADPPPADLFSPERLRALVSDNRLPPQLGFRPGEPPALMLRRGDGFGIVVRFWLEVAPAVHDHNFAGAFYVLEGSSVHSTHRFEMRRRINSRLKLGELAMVDSEVLRAGDVRLLTPGDSFIHGLFHLDEPSVTLTVMTEPNVEWGSQFGYLRPYLAHDADILARLGTERLAMSLLRRLDPDTALRSAVELASSSTYEDAFVLLAHEASSFEATEREEIFDAIERRHGAELGRSLRAVIDEKLWVDNIVMRRADVATVDHRYFMAHLLVESSRDAVLRRIARDMPGDPVDRVLGWLDDLTEESGNGSVSLLGVELEAASPEESLGTFLAAELRALMTGSGRPTADREPLYEALRASPLRALTFAG